MKTGSKIVLIAALVGLLILLVSVLSRMETNSGSQTAKVPAKNRTSKPALTEEAVRDLLTKKSAAGMEEWASAYPHGYIICGVVGGRVISDPHLHELEVQMDSNSLSVAIDQPKQIIVVRVPTMVVSSPGEGQPQEYPGNLERFRFVEHQPVPSKMMPTMFFEVIDASKNIFLIGFK